MRAEKSATANKPDGTELIIFIDREPKHFGMILGYLRNKADGVYIHPSVAQQLMKFGSNKHRQDGGEAAHTDTAQATKPISTSTAFILLPKDSETLMEMYLESIFYNIPELTDHICSRWSTI